MARNADLVAFDARNAVGPQQSAARAGSRRRDAGEKRGVGYRRHVGVRARARVRPGASSLDPTWHEIPANDFLEAVPKRAPVSPDAGRGAAPRAVSPTCRAASK